jgi:hypothetical protein
MSNHFFAEKSTRFADFRHFLGSNKMVEDYARFRAAAATNGIEWKKWPEPMRNGTIRDEIKLNYEIGAVGPMHWPTRLSEEPGTCCPSMAGTAGKSVRPTWAQ